MSIKTIFITLLLILSLEANERIISLSPSITEIVFALQKGKQLVGVSSYSLHPDEARNIPVIGGYESPHLEKIIGLVPTLVVGQTFNINTLEKLQKFNIKTLTLNLKTIKDIKTSIITLANAINSQKCPTLINDINNAIANIHKSKKPHSVMIVFGLREDLRNATYIAGHNIFFEDIIQLTGNTNAYTSQTTNQPVLNYENIIALNPDQIIILHSKASEPNVDVEKALKNWYKIPTNASKNKKISIVDEDYLHIPSHRIALTIERLSREMNYD